MAEMSPLRRRMIEDMTVRNMSPATQRSYISGVAKFSRYFGRSPDKLTLDDVHAFQVHLVSTGISWPSALSQAASVRVAASSAQRPSGTISPDSSATGMNSAGEIMPCSACGQRASPSKPETRLF